jgi:mannose-6-phosphate isomerase-like protein (cupin superfamily)
MDIFNQLNLEVNENPDDIFISRDRVDQHLPMHHHPKSQMLIVENGVANLGTNYATYYVPARHYIWIPLNVEHVVEFKTKGVIIKTIYFNDEDDMLHPFYGKTGIYTINNCYKRC